MNKRILFLAAAAAMLTGCTSDSDTTGSFATTQNAIMHGTSDTQTAHNAVVMLAKKGDFFCTGTLIHPEYVLTAGHCVDGLTSSEKSSFVVGVGNSESAALKKSYAVATIYKHEKYTEKSDGSCYNDIALLKLSSAVPSTVAKPILPLPPEYAVTQAEIDKKGVDNVFSGFGYTERDTYGTKLKMSMGIKGYCGAFNTPKSSTSGCYMGKYTIPVSTWWGSTTTTTESVYTDYGTIFYEQEVGGPCSGDSGGPAFITRNGTEYVLGVTSYGDEACTIYGVSTSVPDFYDWLKTKAPTVFSSLKYENCTDGIDNDGDGKADCMDPDCSFHVSCEGISAENCTDGIDNDKDGLIDCKDPDCAADNACKPYCGDGIVNNDEQCDGKAISQNKTTCVAWDSAKYASGNVSCSSKCTIDFSACKLKPTKEICNDGIDNDQDGILDCKDSDCTLDPACAENCTDGLDNDGDGLIDCDDGYCATHTACIDTPAVQEVCNNLIDDDKDGLIDCADPDCASSSACVLGTPVEICNDNKDNDGDGFIDCFDSDCVSDPVCHQTAEICNDNKDNDGDGFIDCFDSDCKFDSACYVPEATPVEDCTNGIDDDKDGFIDCKDYDCRNEPACASSTVVSKEDCANHYDDDYNGLIDCDDPACLSASECAKKIENCSNGIDDDGDGLIDCKDSACFRDSACIGSVEICGNGIDDDKNGLTDCADPVCFSVCNTAGDKPSSEPTTPAEICNDKIDNDKDGLIDCVDPDCFNSVYCAKSSGGEICDNNLDDDGDLLADCNDPDCVNAPKCKKIEICGNGIDDDGDGLIDGKDPDCNLIRTVTNSCSTTPKSPASMPVLAMLFGLFGLGALLKRRKNS